MNDTELKELALRFLFKHPFSNRSIQSGDQLIIGNVPEYMPTSIPQPPDSNIAGTLVKNEKYYKIILKTKLLPNQAQEFYRKAFSDSDWMEKNIHQVHAGFTFHQMENSLIFCHPKKKLALTIVPFKMLEDLTYIHLTLNLQYDRSPCKESRHLGLPREVKVIPSLPCPAQARQLGSTSGGLSSKGSCFSSTTLNTPLSVGNLAFHYESQLKLLGWELIEKQQIDLFAQSSWTFKDPNDHTWYGVFCAMHIHGVPSLRFLHIQTAIKP